MRGITFGLVLAVAGLAGCDEPETQAPLIRPVRTVVVEKRIAGEPVSLSGQIRAQHEVGLAFRIDGRLVERPVNVGDRVTAGQIVARLDPENERNALRSAEADLAAAQAALTETRGDEERQRALLAQGHTTRARYDQSLQKLRTAESQIEAAQARLRTARDRVGYTELRADAPGSVTAKSAEPGEVVRAGQTIVQVTRKDGKDAVFDLPAQLMRSAPHDPLVAVHLADNKDIRATGRVRELAPQADPATRTHQVKVGLIDPPADMLLGATVVGTIVLNAEPSIEVPGVALTRSDGKPAVWVVDGTSSTVSLRAVTVARYGEATVIVSGGLEDGDVVVTAGVHVLRPGQKVKRADAPQ